MADENPEIITWRSKILRNKLGRKLFWCFCVLCYAVYFTYAIYLDFHKNIALFVLTIFGIVILIVKIIKNQWGSNIDDIIEKISDNFKGSIVHKFSW